MAMYPLLIANIVVHLYTYRNMHEKSPALHCKYCGKSFFSKSNLLSISEATMERGLSNVSIARKPFSGVASEMDIKVSLRKERFTTIFVMKSR